MKSRAHLLLLAMLPGCATWVQETEIPEVMKENRFAFGGTLGTVPLPQSPDKNYAGSYATDGSVTGFAGVRYGIFDRTEVAADFSFSPGLYDIPLAYSVDARARYQWLGFDDGNLVSTVSLGGFIGHAHSSAGPGADSGTAPTPIPNSNPADYLETYSTSTKGFSFSDSVGYKVTPQLTLYAGPKLYWLAADASYEHSVAANSESPGYTGFIYGAFLGGSYLFHLTPKVFAVTDLMFTLIRAPKDLRGDGYEWVPGVSVGGYFSL